MSRGADNRPLPTLGPSLTYVSHHGRFACLLDTAPDASGKVIRIEEFDTLEDAMRRLQAEGADWKSKLREQRKSDRAQYDRSA